MQTKNFEINSSVNVIRGMELLPDGFEEKSKDGFPVAILSHGFGANMTLSMPYGEFLAKNGYAVFMFDFCGGSLPGTGKSTGRPEDMTIETEIGDLLNVINYAKGRPYTDKKNIYLLGGSQGGFVSALAAARHPDEIRKLILLYPAFCIPDDARSGRLGGTNYDKDNPPEYFNCPNGMRISRKFYDGVVDMDPFILAKAYKGPVLIMHGTDDPVVAPEYSKKLRDTYGDDRCSLIMIPGEGHGFSEPARGNVCENMLAFLKA